ncbi:MAG: efflux RND transporter permease subunit, partial [Candidatus Gracilibacteria bacterium]|nr:efflux RND transporter permease subunit [Candidatus Gracilibacteria bacterium]
QIIVDQSKLEHYEVSLSEIVRAIQQNDAQFPLGSIEQNNTQYTLRFEGGLKDTGIIPFIPVTTRGGFPVLVQDLATMTDGLKDITTISRLSVEGRPAQSSVGIEIFKQDGADILRVLDQVESTVAELQKGALSTAEVFVSFNQAKEIRKSLNNLLWNGTQTVIIVFLLLFFFLGLSEAGLAGMSIPFTFLIALTALSALGFTLNFLTLFSLILSLGILVDAAIVMVEGMHEQINRGKSAIQAAKDTIHEFQWPIISGVMTTVSAFFPMIFASGVTGQFIRTIPVTVSIVLISSLFVALGVTPVLGSRFLKGLFKHDKPSEKKKRVVFIDHMATWYRVRLEHFLGNKKEKRIFSVLMVGAFVFAMSLPFLGAVKIELFPTPDLDQFSIQIEAPIGTVVEQTDQYTRELENLLYQDIRI